MKVQFEIRPLLLNLMRIFFFLFVVGVLIWGFFSPNDANDYNIKQYEPVTEGWTQIVDGESIALSDISDYTKGDVGEAIVLERTVDEEMMWNSLVFYAEHQEIVISVDGEILYELYCPEYLGFFGTPGCKWVNFHIYEEMLGETITLTVTSNFAIFNSVPSEIYFVGESEILMLQMQFMCLRNLVAIFILGLAVVTYLNARLWKEKKKRRFLFCMADLYFFSGMWLCSEINILEFFIGRTSLSALFAMMILRVIPVSFYHFCLSMMRYKTKFTYVSGFLAWGNLWISVILQFVFKISLIDLIWFNIAVATILAIRTTYVMIMHYRSRVKHELMDLAFYGAFIFIIAYAVECFIYVSYDSNSRYLGTAAMIAFSAYAMFVHILLVKNESKVSTKKGELEVEYNNLHKKPLNQQINAHFFFNSLNTISAYCKEDPMKADRAVRVLAEYMHSYTSLVGSSDYVAVEEELELLESYMTIQNIRFENRIKFTVENNCDDVMIPPLALQTLVENSINHGLCNRNYNGEIKIKIVEKYDMFEIIVSDNGVGFNLDLLKETSGIGFLNLRRRINAMGGIVEIKSEEQKGTTVSLLVPRVILDEIEG